MKVISGTVESKKRKQCQCNLTEIQLSEIMTFEVQGNAYSIFSPRSTHPLFNHEYWSSFKTVTGKGHSECSDRLSPPPGKKPADTGLFFPEEDSTCCRV